MLDIPFKTSNPEEVLHNMNPNGKKGEKKRDIREENEAEGWEERKKGRKRETDSSF